MLLRLGQFVLNDELRAFQSGPAHPVITATVDAPESGSEEQYAWDVTWSDAAKTARELGADPASAEVLPAGAGDVVADGGTRVTVAANGEILLARWVPFGFAAPSIQVGTLPHLIDVAAAVARRPAHVVVLADRDGAAVIAHATGDMGSGVRFGAGDRPGAEKDPHPGRPPALHHGERHQTGPEPASGGSRNDTFIAGRVADAAASVDAHVVLGAGDQHLLDAVSGHLPGSLGPIVTIETGPVSLDDDTPLRARIGATLDGIAGEAIASAANQIASLAAKPDPGAVIGAQDVASQLAEQQVAVLLVAPGFDDAVADELVWSALHQDAIVARAAGPLSGQPVAALLRRGQPRRHNS
jgi:hypothetical protein